MDTLEIIMDEYKGHQKKVKDIEDNKKTEQIYNKEIKKYINSYLENNPHNYFYMLIEKYDYKYYKNNNNIDLEFDIKISSSKIDNIKGGKFNEW